MRTARGQMSRAAFVHEIRTPSPKNPSPRIKWWKRLCECPLSLKERREAGVRSQVGLFLVCARGFSRAGRSGKFSGKFRRTFRQFGLCSGLVRMRGNCSSFPDQPMPAGGRESPPLLHHVQGHDPKRRKDAYNGNRCRTEILEHCERAIRGCRQSSHLAKRRRTGAKTGSHGTGQRRIRDGGWRSVASGNIGR